MTIYGLLIWFVKLVCSLEVIVSITLGVIVFITLGVIVSMITVFFISGFSVCLLGEVVGKSYRIVIRVNRDI